MTHHEWLVEKFANRLLAQEPISLLDVGCGSGTLLRTLQKRGIDCIGLDQSGPRLDALRDEGLRVDSGSAYDLPFSDHTLEWVTMRHIPHHLEDPARAFREALRVARCGVLIAEPWFDVSLASQRAALRYDRFEKSLDRQRGNYHAESLSLDDLLDAMPQGYEFEWEVSSHTDLRLEKRDVDEALTAARSRLEEVPANDPLHDEFKELASELRRDGLSRNGSLLLMLRAL